MFSHVRRKALRLCRQAVNSCVEGVNPRGKHAVLAAVLLAKLAGVASEFAKEPKNPPQ